MGCWRRHDLLWFRLRSQTAVALLCDSLCSTSPRPSNRNLTASQTSLSAIFCVLLILTPRFGSPRFKTWRAVLYATFGLSSATFVVHGLVLHGWEVQKDRLSLVRMGGMAAMNLFGAMVYTARVTCLVPHSSLPPDASPDSREMGALHIRCCGRQPPDLPHCCRGRSLGPLPGTSCVFPSRTWHQPLVYSIGVTGMTHRLRIITASQVYGQLEERHT